ncbi:hypothetical protein [Streptomyces sp. NPDC093261]|uniref:hypothetical protein n=1 Tax=Streptomyces sp. NPDC093261 TaxID=3366037 RepID=UPI0037F31EDE
MPLYAVGNGGASSPTDINQYMNLLTGVSTDQPVTVSQRIRAQLSGASAGTGGYVGQTSGPPTSGTFNTGDFTADSAGGLWVCTAAGSPGTWGAVGLVPINVQTLGANAASVTYNGLPGGFRHLFIICNAQSTDTASSLQNVNMGLSTMTGNWMGSATWFQSNGGGVQTADGSGVTTPPVFKIPAAGGSSASNMGGGVMWMPNYTSSTGTKMFHCDSMAYSGNGSTITWQTTRRSGWIWRQASLAGLNLTLTPSAGSFAAGSFLGLYGSN